MACVVNSDRATNRYEGENMGISVLRHDCVGWLKAIPGVGLPVSLRSPTASRSEVEGPTSITTRPTTDTRSLSDWLSAIRSGVDVGLDLLA